MNAPGQALAQALRSVTYEVLPFASTEDTVLAHVPRDVKLTVTTTEAKGLEPTLDLAVRLSRQGYAASPHLAARLVRDRRHLEEVVDRLTGAGVDGVFVIGGDAPEAAGPYPDALSLLQALEETGHRFTHVGIGGYPEGHGRLSADVVDAALVAKAPHSSYIVSQLCFRPEATLAWAQGLAERGVHLPVRVGIPGAVSRAKLVRISAGLGLGASARFLSKQQSLLWRFFVPSGYRPDRLVTALTPALTAVGQHGAGQHGAGQHGAGQHLVGFHVYTFNDVAGTEAWRRRWLAQLGDQPATGAVTVPEPGLR